GRRANAWLIKVVPPFTRTPARHLTRFATAVASTSLNGRRDPVQCAAHRAVSSAVEHCLHTARVAGSNPAPPTRHEEAGHWPAFSFAAPMRRRPAVTAPPRSPSGRSG